MVIGNKRRPKRLFSTNRRHQGLFAGDILYIHKVQSRISNLFAYKRISSRRRSKLMFKRLIGMNFIRYHDMMKLSPHVHLRYPRRDRTIATYHPQEIEELFRFRSASQLKTVFNALQIPYRVTLSNGEWFFGEEIFVIGLRRLNYPCKLGTLVRTEFGRSVSSISRAFKYFVQHVYSNFWVN